MRSRCSEHTTHKVSTPITDMHTARIGTRIPIWRFPEACGVECIGYASNHAIVKTQSCRLQNCLMHNDLPDLVMHLWLRNSVTCASWKVFTILRHQQNCRTQMREAKLFASKRQWGGRVNNYITFFVLCDVHLLLLGWLNQKVRDKQAPNTHKRNTAQNSSCLLW